MAIWPPLSTMSFAASATRSRPFLMHQAGDDAEQRTFRWAQAQAGAHHLGVGLLAVQVVRIEMVRQMRIAAWVPAFIDPVDDPRQLAFRRPGSPSGRAGRRLAFRW